MAIAAMKVCFISHSASRGGAELSLLDLVDALAKRGVHCSCVLPSPGTLTDLLADRGIETAIVKYKPWVHKGPRVLRRAQRTLRNLQALLPLVRVIKGSGCDVVYTNTIAVGVGALAAKIAGKPHVWHIREFGYEDHNLSFDLGLRISRRLMGWLSKACIANSRAVAEEHAPHLCGTKLSVVYNSVVLDPPRKETAIDAPWRREGALRCIVVGRLQPQKGQEDAVMAMAELRRMHVPAELLLLGDADSAFRAYMDRKVRELALTDCVHLHGFSENPMGLMRSADVLLMCSRREAFGRVTVEAMKLGKPVIGARSGGTPEIVKEGETGYLYAPGDPTELAARIRDLYANPRTREAMGAEGRRQADERFTPERYGAEVEDILRRVAFA
jgi:glycosyltransferase involved in cell wall biosynthesis